MRRVVGWMIALAVTGWGAVDKAAVHAIVKKMENVYRMTPSAEVAFPLYDPFKRTKPLIEKAIPITKPALPPPSRPRLLAIMGDKAFINRKWVKAGMRVAGWRVERVSRRGVWLVRDTEKLFLPERSERTLLEMKDRE